MPSGYPRFTRAGNCVRTKDTAAASVKNLLPGKKRLEIPDGGSPGFRLIVQPSGQKALALRFRRPDGRPGKLTLGSLDLTGNEMGDDPVIGRPLTLAGARKLAPISTPERNRTRPHHRSRLGQALAVRSSARSGPPMRSRLWRGAFIEEHATSRRHELGAVGSAPRTSAGPREPSPRDSLIGGASDPSARLR